MLTNLISLALGIASITREKIDTITNILVEKGEMQKEEARTVAEKLVEKGEAEREAYIAQLADNIEKIRSRLVTREDIEKLEKKLEEIDRFIKEM